MDKMLSGSLFGCDPTETVFFPTEKEELVRFIRFQVDSYVGAAPGLHFISENEVGSVGKSYTGNILQYRIKVH